MAKNQKHDYEDDFDDFDDDFLEVSDNDYDLNFNDNKTSRKSHRAKPKRSARHRIEDYFERKAMKDTDWNWDFDYDYD
ncbi:hypothetical protein GCM10009133_19900 [Cocleimonas flava]|jgi:hypothetical protein|uniref:Uncharacterized protein n=1 Tax=Cocleimonas flava TaxID=634765 RepID=A0A4R1EUI0_9GAMM|nr:MULTISPECIES: hypothetical protein [Cocleimonas]MEB8433765.1 hypothetical protein [Cocleimonas sp. KMM 6892]MEC4716576.1 hypothetical protein [Cocleimonas sp. KMM 6895]MEC4746269.1 hypothetical protein [Cocleimonas sp. KMM 6896]TCJ84913.1 hypothetical protein EV695_2876 [Cocleimonas flava]